MIKRFIPKVTKIYLLVIAGIVWFIAGFNIVRIGLLASTADKWNLISALTSLLIFASFFSLVFRPMVKKHTVRIMGYTSPKMNIYNFFDTKAYCIMTFMITFGILLRKSNLWPPHCIAVFYLGLGSSLIAAGVNFVGNFVIQKRK